METIEESIEHAFVSMVERKDFEEALDFIGGCINKRPGSAVIREIIFKILMDEDCEKKTAVQAGMYLSKILTVYPPSDFSRRNYYKHALTNKDYPSLWRIFCHLVESSFCYYKIYRLSCDEQDSQIKPVQYPSCDILIDYYVKVLLESYDYLASESFFGEKKEKSLVGELFWPSQDLNLSAAKENPRHFLEWINKIYEHMARIEKVSVFKNLHQLLNLMIKCIIDAEQMRVKTDTLPDCLLSNSTCLLDIVKVIMNTCKDALATHESFRQFVNYISLKSMQLKICEYRLYELLYSRQRSERNVKPTTLKDLVNIYMFNNKSTKKVGRPKKSTVEPHENLPRLVMTVKEREDNDRRLNWTAADDKGLTPLHVAIKNNACDITKMILRKGGHVLLYSVDAYGRKPHDYATSKEMEELLSEFPLPDSGQDSSTPISVFSLNCPILNNFRENALYFHALQFFLSYYCDIYNLYEILTLKPSEVQVYQHKDNMCPHFVIVDKNGICSEDFEYLDSLKDIINHFIKSATKGDKEKDLNLDLELLPLKLFVTTLNK